MQLKSSAAVNKQDAGLEMVWKWGKNFLIFLFFAAAGEQRGAAPAAGAQSRARAVPAGTHTAQPASGNGKLGKK